VVLRGGLGEQTNQLLGDILRLVIQMEIDEIGEDLVFYLLLLRKNEDPDVGQ